MPIFQKRHYEALASAIKLAREQANKSQEYIGALYGIGMIEAEISALLAKDNPQFDGERFALASGMRDQQ